MKARRKSSPRKRPLNLREAAAESLCLRQGISVRADTVNEAERSVRIVLASETPVRIFDWDSWEVIDEVLLMDGLETPPQLPMLNCHLRYSTKDVIGSIRSLEKKGTELEGTAVFARSEDGQAVFDLVREGHLTDFSIGFRAVEVERVKRGETATIAGRKFKGPVRVVTRAVAKEGSAVPIGADPTAKAREADVDLLARAYLDPDSLRDDMNKLKALCIRLGMAEDEADVAGWLTRHLEAKPDPKGDDGKSLLPQILEALREERKPDPAPKPDPKPEPKEERQEGETADQASERILAVMELCDKHSVQASKRAEWIKAKITPDQVARKILDERQADRAGDSLGLGKIEHVDSEHEKFYRAASAALTLRAIQSARVNPEAALERARGIYSYNVPGEGQVKVPTGAVDPDAVQRCESLIETIRKPPEGFREFRHAGLLDMARIYCEMHGRRTAFWPRQQIAREAIRLSNVEMLRMEMMQQRGAYNTTGSFANLMLDAANKTLLAAYDEAMVTYPVWVRNAPSAPDFKALNRIRFGELPDPEVVPENHPYPEKQTSDGKESYAVEKYGEIFSVSLEAIINDDLNAISRIPSMQGAAMRRKINKVVYAILTSNPPLSDGVAIFHATSHGGNLDAAVPSVTAFNDGYRAMMLQTGLSGSGTILNIMPRYVISGATLSASILQILNSIADPAAGGSAAGNANTHNLYGPSGQRQLVPVFDGQIDAAAASTPTGWWFAADPSQVDTIELTFLQGEESPALDREEGFNVDAVKYKIRQTFAAKAIDYRGLYQGNAVG